VRHDFKGHVHFREFPRSDGVDTVPILILDKTQYMYAAAAEFPMPAANDVQLVGMAEFRTASARARMSSSMARCWKAWPPAITRVSSSTSSAFCPSNQALTGDRIRQKTV